jgi:hypothetical protein
VQDEVVAAGQAEQRQHLGHALGELLEGVDDRPVQRPHLDRHQRLYAAVEGAERHLGVVALQHAAPGQRADPLQHRGGGDSQSACELPVGLPGIPLQFGQDRRIKLVHET